MIVLRHINVKIAHDKTEGVSSAYTTCDVTVKAFLLDYWV